MSIRRVCKDAVNHAVGSGYLIRSYVSASRSEIRPYSCHALGGRPSTSRISSRTQPRRMLATRQDNPFDDSPSLHDSPESLATSEYNHSAPQDEEHLSSGVGVKDEANETISAESLGSNLKSDLPWYLQPDIADSLPSQSPLLERQKLPDLPVSPPPILETLLSHVSLELGMDDLSLLDLRTLDPPAALGSNLIMILGTARSEKHLHVSADRLCRWLRTDHQLRPFADGLLGRNELKLKQKRKAKRSRLLSSVGAKATGAGDMDDGIRTGWVCVNIGEVEGGVLPHMNEVSDGFVGFRSEVKGCRIVVQMMTEEKRGLLDLETLWTGMLNRSGGEAERAEEKGETLHAAKLDRRHANASPFPEAQTTTITTNSQMGTAEAQA
ncbi:hypothetical protein CAC42_6142 [Sphaceloma murrayae]|uniref:ATPase synthesis protein 25 n=1 Tax=Sphaceloma murrayae TaxID=2082308 RepID=A0A2K1QTF1_9PEZI|nr:hypothetical protein CAC42_6142 [Sphaceloma murrayae]